MPESSIPGESPPPPPRTCFGRDELIEEVIGLAENLTPVALVGAGGIGKTSIALTVLHRDRIRQRFGDSRRFIRCDQFPASTAHFLNRLSMVIGAGVENPEDLTPLRPFLSSREMILVLDNAESILDPKGPGAREIYAVVEELSRFKTVSLCITSRISTVPRHWKRPMIPTLSMKSASDIFHDIHNDGGRSDIIDNLLRRLDFHALSITLLATTASHNMWDYNRLAREWDTHRVQVLQTDYDESLAATIELSLASPTFRELGPSARDLLGVIAFFPQGIDENNIDWLFPTIPNRRTIFDKSCVLSLTYRSKGFTRMLAPLRDYLRPKDPASSPLLHMAKMRYFSRLSVDVWPSNPDFADTSWITSEDVNVEHLLDVFTTIDANSNDVWNACRCFMEHLYWHKRRLVMLGSKIEALPDDHLSKPGCLIKLSLLSRSIGNGMEYKRLLLCALNLWQERGDPHQIANTLKFLSDVNRMLGLYEEGIEQVREALEIYKWLNDKSGQAKSWHCLARLLHEDKQLDAAEEAASRAINLLDDRLWVCLSHRLLGAIYGDKGETKKAINHYETALGIASPFNWHDQQFWIHYSLADLFFDANRFDAAHAHVEHAKSHTVNDPYCLGRATHLRAAILYRECKFEEAQSEALGAADVFEKFGAAKDLERCRKILRDIEAGRGGSATSGQSDFNGELLEIDPPTSVNSPLSAWGAGHPSVNFEQLAPRPYEYSVPNHRAH